MEFFLFIENSSSGKNPRADPSVFLYKPSVSCVVAIFFYMGCVKLVSCGFAAAILLGM